MFFKLFLQKPSAIIFSGGFTFVLLFSVLRKVSFVGSVLSGLLGGIGLICLWALLLKMLTMILVPQELEDLFNLNSSLDSATGQQLNILDTDDDDENTLKNDSDNGDEVSELSFQELYKNIEADSEVSDSDYSRTQRVHDEVAHEKRMANFIQDNAVANLEPGGKFSLTVDGKMITVPAEDGANAVRKVLHDDKQ